MSLEIERKFLVTSETWREAVLRSEPLRQGYLSASSRASVRVRIAGDRAWLNLKSRVTGPVRHEFEYEVSRADAEQMLAFMVEGSIVEKVRHIVPWQDAEFEVDEFRGVNAGLVVAELELDHVDAPYPRPPWLGHEVTNDVRYYNSSLASHPWSGWGGGAPRP
jgi:adenylate cyclase